MRSRKRSPRVLIVTRPTRYERLLVRHGTHQQAHFFLQQREQGIDVEFDRHRRFHEALADVVAQVPSEWRYQLVPRALLDRFLFGPDDIVVVLGQDGLVANVAKYIDGQPVLGLNPEPGVNPGVLVRHAPAAAGDLLVDTWSGRAPLSELTMIQAQLDDGRTLLALNEVFVGHRSHQSARYELAGSAGTELQSSSGLVVSSGTGATGWASSIHRATGSPVRLPAPSEPRVVFFVREAWSSPSTGTDITQGDLKAGEMLSITSRMEDGGVLFGDGIEADFLAFSWGERARVGAASRVLRLVGSAPSRRQASPKRQRRALARVRR